MRFVFIFLIFFILGLFNAVAGGEASPLEPPDIPDRAGPFTARRMSIFTFECENFGRLAIVVSNEAGAASRLENLLFDDEPSKPEVFARVSQTLSEFTHVSVAGVWCYRPNIWRFLVYGPSEAGRKEYAFISYLFEVTPSAVNLVQKFNYEDFIRGGD